MPFRFTSSLFLVRHGETEWNLVPRIQGRSDSSLTRRGEDQARAAGALLRRMIGRRPVALLSSPLGRARRTAEIIAAELGLSSAAIDIEPRLAEVSWGSWEGLSRAEIEAAVPDGWRRVQSEWDFVPDGAESYPRAAERFAAWLEEMRGRGPAVAVTHGIASCILRGLAQGLSGAESLALERPQDALFRIEGGRVERLDFSEASSPVLS
jgi:broad specificity phosphatase PhoE